jgi:hypothetical protein
MRTAAYSRAIDAGLTRSQAQRYSDYHRRKTVLPKRDSEKTKTYNAEWKLENEHPELIGPLNEFKDVEKFVKQVTCIQDMGEGVPIPRQGSRRPVA